MDKFNKLLVSCLEQRRAHYFTELQGTIKDDNLRYSKVYNYIYLGILIETISEANDYSTLLKIKFEADELSYIIEAITLYGSNFDKRELELVAEFILVKAKK